MGAPSTAEGLSAGRSPAGSLHLKGTQAVAEILLAAGYAAAPTVTGGKDLGW